LWTEHLLQINRENSASTGASSKGRFDAFMAQGRNKKWNFAQCVADGA